ncbi:MAG TPA: DUF4388 domain-containing protein [Anaeromyxobacter sp.]|nr:DUF4388 domain-containing protein [Anaeromyxobacter sp.]
MTTVSFDLDAHGRLVPQSDEARRALADRAGRFLLLPSAGDLLVARRTPAIGGAAPRPRCVLAGDLGGFPIADLLAFVHQSRLSGVLTVVADGAERSVAFQEGEVRSARSSAHGERIGEVAVRLGFATEAQVARATAGGGPTGKALVDQGALSASDLWKCLHEQVSVVFHGILLSPSGTFFLLDEDPAERHGTPLAVNTQSLLMDGIRRIDELSLFRARIPGPAAFLRRRDPPRPVTLRPTESSLLALVDGRRTVAEMASAAHVSEFDATKVLYHLAEAGYVEAVADPLASAAPADRIPALLSGLNRLLRAVTAAIPPGARAEFLDAGRAFLAQPEGPFAPVLLGLAPAADGALDEASLAARVAALDRRALARLHPSGDPARVLLGALREALFFWLFQAGERIAPDADESLGRTVKAKLAALEGLA